MTTPTTSKDDIIPMKVYAYFNNELIDGAINYDFVYDEIQTTPEKFHQHVLNFKNEKDYPLNLFTKQCTNVYTQRAICDYKINGRRIKIQHQSDKINDGRIEIQPQFNYNLDILSRNLIRKYNSGTSIQNIFHVIYEELYPELKYFHEEFLMEHAYELLELVVNELNKQCMKKTKSVQTECSPEVEILIQKIIQRIKFQLVIEFDEGLLDTFDQDINNFAKLNPDLQLFYRSKEKGFVYKDNYPKKIEN
jgi:hypothetical protein